MRTTIRELAGDDRAATAIAASAGPHGVYVHNALVRGEGEGFVLAIDGRDTLLAWTGPRGNLVLIATGELPPQAAARTVDELFLRRRPWRIAMGPQAVVDALRERLQVQPLAFRDQVYYAGTAATVDRARVRADVRPAQRADRDRLVQATLALNQADLNVDPARVDRRWLRDTIDERILTGTTWVLGPVGGPWCKLDLGSDGPAGRMIEGVFTFAEQRGQGLAAALVASCIAAAPGQVCLHVGRHNRPARAAYERAGMQAAGTCRLLLLP